MSTLNSLLDYCWQLTQHAETELRRSEQQQHQLQREIEQQASLLTRRYVNDLSKQSFTELQHFAPEFSNQQHIRLAYKNAYILGLFKSPDYASTLLFIQAEFKARQLHTLSQQTEAKARQRLAQNQQLAQSYKSLQTLRQTLLNYLPEEDDDDASMLQQLRQQLETIARNLGLPALSKRPVREPAKRQDEDDSISDMRNSETPTMLFTSHSFSATHSATTSAWQQHDSETEHQAFPDTPPDCPPDQQHLTPGSCREPDRDAAHLATDDSLGRFS